MAHHADALRAEGETEAVIEATIVGDDAGLDARRRALVAYARKLTLLTSPMTVTDLEPLRAVGLDDDAILHLVQVVAYFNYVNRHAEATGIPLEDGHPGRRWAELLDRRGASAARAGDAGVVVSAPAQSTDDGEQRR